MLYKILVRENPLDRSQKKFYAAPSYVNDVNLRKVAQDISKNCTLTPADIAAVLESFLDKLPDYLEEGHSIKMGEFGRFRLSFSSKGQDKKDDVSPNDIKKSRIIFVPSPALKTRLEEIAYEER
ncbi:MAG: HU family DNA-binding protein [Bacteroides sp.]|nr:HU family DNA-binding protein [Prevotella sp.]MCM1408251.1 HU family DNA-binding protein [Treponema brennaborense]MCM1469575.1 HU family DNA-binding protein [Bacteroides sp.]